MSGARKKVVAAMSGGVDSSVAAALLLEQGYEVLGVFMRLGTPGGVEPAQEACEVRPEGPAGAIPKQGCCSVLDAADARRVAGMLGIPFYVLNFQEEFGRILDYFVREYNAGRTPNPCVRCNDWLKFGKLARYAEAVGADYVASGHYARIGTDPLTGDKALMRGKDHRKDQSYVLFGMSRRTLEHTLLPIGEFEKHEVRAIAQRLGLPVYNKPDSQEICFVPGDDYAALVRRRSPESFAQGEIVTADGKVVGTHPGHQHFTIGQRRGVGVAFGRPIYVVGIDAAQNRVVLGDKGQLLKTTLWARQVNVISSRMGGWSERTKVAQEDKGTTGQGEQERGGTEAGRGGTQRDSESAIGNSKPAMDQSAISGGLICQAKIRYNHPPQPARAMVTGDDEIKVVFDEPQSAITPGQAVVLFDGDLVLGGGWIDRSE